MEDAAERACVRSSCLSIATKPLPSAYSGQNKKTIFCGALIAATGLFCHLRIGLMTEIKRSTDPRDDRCGEINVRYRT